MNKYIISPFLLALAVGFFAFAGMSSSSAYRVYQNQGQQGASCPSYYHPVCGEKSGQQTVYQNICTMNSAGATFVKWKSCGYSFNTSYYNQYSNTYNYRNDYINSWQYEQPRYVDQPVCSQEYNPVCAVKNGYKKSYSNKCFARQNGADFLNFGSCDQKIKQKITCYFSNSNTTQSCSVVNGNSSESCSGKTSCSFYTVARKKYSQVAIKNTCESAEYISITGTSQKVYAQCRPVHQCVARSTPYCGYNQKKVFKGYDSYGCNRGYKCVNTYMNTYSSYNGYTNNYGYRNNYNSRYNHYNSSYSNNTPSFSLSRSQNNLSASLSPNTVFVMNVYAEETGSTITHIIPQGIELLSVTKGSCQITKVYGGTRLRCNNTDTLQYKAKTGYGTTCQKKFTTTFANYNYNNLSRSFTLTVR